MVVSSSPSLTLPQSLPFSPGRRRLMMTGRMQREKHLKHKLNQPEDDGYTLVSEPLIHCSTVISLSPKPTYLLLPSPCTVNQAGG